MLIWFSLASLAVAQVNRDKLAKMPNALFLAGWPPYKLSISSNNRAMELQSDGGDWYITPSMSADGRIVATAQRVPSEQPKSRPKLVVGTYSVETRKWTAYEELHIFGGSVAISPDGFRLACTTSDSSGAVSTLRILDLASGRMTTGPDSTQNAGSLSWSPDGRRLAFDLPVQQSRDGLLFTNFRSVYVLDVDSQALSKVAEGISPAWSPSGQWIAFYGYSPDSIHQKRMGDGIFETRGPDYRLSVIGPNGTKATILDSRKAVGNSSPVWSPDSKTILINQFRDEGGGMDIYAVDVATRKRTKKFRNVQPVYAWVAAK